MSDVHTPEKTETLSPHLVSVTNQYAMVPAQSPLQHQKPISDNVATEEQGLTMKEVALMGHLVLRGDSDNPLFVETASQVLGLALPTQPLTSVEKAGKVVCWLSPDEWLILTEADELYALELALRTALTGHISIVNQSGGQTIIELSGRDVNKVLKKSTPLDIHPRVFPIGKVAGSVLAKSSALIRRIDEYHWQLVIRRSFADYIWRWLEAAGQEYGVSIESHQTNSQDRQ
ncbi:sarcosine oxidase subunit gamma family protein [Vibrio sp. S4M6]|uniref:sarcosine oxidase subunit gamma n=1 Tax=Vibrio sinus TaxID=2946865 RepID=UPI00202A7D7B|nr:sarcosine oxidase subunit gamma family protein [Vibrio sinus]MCL9783391.1 sarcosine oxidase subunit gamma family protein [Vibrio sinus]